MMSVHLAGLTSPAGLPLFSRHVGSSSSETSATPESSSGAIPYATLAALNGVNLYSRLKDVNLLMTSTKNSKIRWKVFKGSIVLILIVSCPPGADVEHVSDAILENTLQYIFDSMIICCGLNEIMGSNVERLKKSLKKSYQLVDHYLKCLLSFNRHPNLLYGAVSIIHVEPHVFEFSKSLVEYYSHELCSSSLSCLMTNGKVVAGTKGWWNQLSTSRDAFIIVNLVLSIAPSFSDDESKVKEMRVFLPENSPESAFRLIIAQIYPNIHLVVICGDTPSLQDMESHVKNLLEDPRHKEPFQILQSLKVSSFLPIDERILTFCLFRNDNKTFLKYGHFDQTKLKDMLTMIEMTGRHSDPSGSIDFSENYAKFKHTTGYHVSHNNLTLIIFCSSQLPLSFVQSVSYKTFNMFKDKKMGSIIN